MKSKNIPITRAKEISAFGYDEVIIFGANYETGVQHVTTYGKSVIACENAAKGGNAIKALLGWPPAQCNSKPPRQRAREKLKSETVEKDRILTGLIQVVDNPSNSDLLNFAKCIGLAVAAKKLMEK